MLLTPDLQIEIMLLDLKICKSRPANIIYKWSRNWLQGIDLFRYDNKEQRELSSLFYSVTYIGDNYFSDRATFLYL